MTVRLTTAQALVTFLEQQYVQRDGQEHQFFAGMLGIFGHGNVAGIGEALVEHPGFRYILTKNEQGAVHMAAGFAKASNRLRAFACTSSIGPGATNMITGAAAATINRLPVLLLPGDIFARRNVAPVLQQLESPQSQDVSVNDCFRPVSKYWDRIYRPEQLITALPAAMRVLTSPADTGVVTLAMPQDVQAEAYDYPEELLRKRVWVIRRPAPDAESFAAAVDAIRHSRTPIIVAGGGVLYSEASQALASFASQTGIPVAETYAGKGSLPFDFPQNVGAIGSTGTLAANRLAHDADLVIGIGTRYSDFTTASHTLFQHPDLRFVNINVAEFDAYKASAIPLVADARVTLAALADALRGHRVSADYAGRISALRTEWDREVDRLFNLHGSPPAQSEIIGALTQAIGPRDIMVSAAGGHPADLHKLWQTHAPNGFHLEYGYSCMGYEIPAAIGVKLADPQREVYAVVGDGTYLLNPTEILTALQERLKITIIVLDNHGFGCINSLSRAVGCGGFGTLFRERSAASGQLDGDVMPVDFVANAKSLGADAIQVRTLDEFRAAIHAASHGARTNVIVIETTTANAPGYDAWWDCAVAEVAHIDEVARARRLYEERQRRERDYLAPSSSSVDAPPGRT